MSSGMLCIVLLILSSRATIIDAFLENTTTSLHFLTKEEIVDLIDVQYPESLNPQQSTSIEPYFVYLKETIRMDEFVYEIQSNFAKTVEMEFIGGQYRSIILNCNINIFLNISIQKFVESFFELPLLARIERDVFEKASLEAFSATEKNTTLQFMFFSSMNSLREPFQAMIPLTVNLHSKQMTNGTQSSYIQQLVRQVRNQQRSTLSRTLSDAGSTVQAYLASHHIRFNQADNKHSLRLVGSLLSMVSLLVPLSQHSSIRSIQRLSKPIRANLYMRPLISDGVYVDLDTVPLSIQRNLKGQNMVIGVCDTGLDYRSTFFYDAEHSVKFGMTPSTDHRKISLYYDYAGRKEYETDGHGTHVAGTILGKALDPDVSPCDGLVPEAKVMLYDIEDNYGDMVYPGTMDTWFFPTFYDVGVRIINNSWGYDVTYYNSDCRRADSYIFNHPDMIAVFAAGNSGDEGYTTVMSPSLAKNVITVGAAGTQSYNSVNENYVKYFSSRGTLGGPIKPDVCGIGRSQSAKSYSDQKCQGNCDGHSGTEHILSLLGVGSFIRTSMAAPSVTAAAAVIYQYLRDGYYSYSLPIRASLVKAMIVHSTVPMTGACPYSGTNCVPFTSRPNVIQGHGRVVLKNVLHFSDTVGWELYLNVTTFKTNMVSQPYTFTLTSISAIKVTLVWSDPAASSSSTNVLINDLDVCLTFSHSGATVYPNGLTTKDHQNNVEVITLTKEEVEDYLDGAQDLTFDVVVTKTALVQNQEYSIVVTGDFASSVIPTTELPTEQPPLPEDPTILPTEESGNEQTIMDLLILLIIAVVFVLVMLIIILFLAYHSRKNQKRNSKKITKKKQLPIKPQKPISLRPVKMQMQPIAPPPIYSNTVQTQVPYPYPQMGNYPAPPVSHPPPLPVKPGVSSIPTQPSQPPPPPPPPVSLPPVPPASLPPVPPASLPPVPPVSLPPLILVKQASIPTNTLAPPPPPVSLPPVPPASQPPLAHMPVVISSAPKKAPPPPVSQPPLMPTNQIPSSTSTQSLPPPPPSQPPPLPQKPKTTSIPTKASPAPPLPAKPSGMNPHPPPSSKAHPSSSQIASMVPPSIPAPPPPIVRPTRKKQDVTKQELPICPPPGLSSSKQSSTSVVEKKKPAPPSSLPPGIKIVRNSAIRPPPGVTRSSRSKSSTISNGLAEGFTNPENFEVNDIAFLPQN